MTGNTEKRIGGRLALAVVALLLAGCINDPVDPGEIGPSFARGGSKAVGGAMSLAGGLAAQAQPVDARETNRWLTAKAASFEATYSLQNTQNDPDACTVVEDGPVDRNRLLQKLVDGPVARTLELQFDRDAIGTGLESHDHVVTFYRSGDDENVAVSLGRNEAGEGNFLVVSPGPNENEYVLSGGTVRVRITDKTVRPPAPQGWIRCPLAAGDEVTVTLPAPLP